MKTVMANDAKCGFGPLIEFARAEPGPRTTKLYDRTGDKITLDEVERITI
jgi:hypothetical protein